MQSRIAALTMMVVLAMTPGAIAGGKKEDKTSVSFHSQAEPTDNAKMTFTQLANGKTLSFNRLPDFSLKDIALFNPFPSTVGEDYGLVFKLKPSASERLAAITAANQGRWMIAQINGRVVDGVTIDKQITDGVLVIWKGVTLADVELLDKELKRAGAEKKKN